VVDLVSNFKDVAGKYFRHAAHPMQIFN